MSEWADDRPSTFDADMRCADDQCGWHGLVAAIRSYGSTTMELQECPRCGEPLELA